MTLQLKGESIYTKHFVVFKRMPPKNTENLTKYTNLMWSADNQEAQTPPEVWEVLKEEWGEMFDPCPPNPKFDGLSIPWKKINYCNPPYNQCKEWMIKCIEEFKKGNTTICLIPCRCHTNWFHSYVLPYATTIKFVKNGVRFVGYKRKSPFPVCIVVFDPSKRGTQTFESVDFYAEKVKKRKSNDTEQPKKKCKNENALPSIYNGMKPRIIAST